MRVIISSNLYFPLLGGTVTVADRWARELALQGHQVIILTKTPGEGVQTYGEWLDLEPQLRSGAVTVCRFTGFLNCRRLVKTADRVVIVEMSLKSMMVALAALKWPLITHHTHYNAHGAGRKPYRIVQYLMGLLAPSAACSEMIARGWGPHVGVIPNPYEPEVFHDAKGLRDIDFLFVGRLVSDKGALLFVEALARIAPEFLRVAGHRLRFAIAGNGPEEDEIRSRISAADLDESKAFFGLCEPAELAVLYNRSRAVVVPSVWIEPFGLIALEALACGCQVLCSDQAGLREASGNMGLYFKTASMEGIAQAMLRVMSQSGGGGEIDAERLKAHLDRHQVRNSVLCVFDAGKRWKNSGNHDLTA